MEELTKVLIFIIIIALAICLICVCINNKLNLKIIGGVEKLTREIIKKPSKKFIESIN